MYLVKEEEKIKNSSTLSVPHDNETSKLVSYQQEFTKLKSIKDQVIHDIKSPIGLLNVALENIHTKSEQSINLLKIATERIESIVNDLDNMESTLIKKVDSKVNIFEALQNLITAKRAECPQAKISFKYNSKETCALLNQGEFHRVLSNIINNSLESVENKVPLIKVDLISRQDFMTIDICDNGMGIPKRIQKQVFKRGFTFNKLHGKGLGLSYSHEKIQSWDGDIKILISKKEGTTLRLFIPRSF